MTRLVLFDIDLTLVTTNGAGRSAMTGAFQQLFGIANATEGIRFDGRTDRAIFLETLAAHGLASDGGEVYHRAVGGYLDLLPASLDAKGGRILPGVPELLDALQRADIPVGLATGNMRLGARAKLGYFGLWERFATGGFGDNTAFRVDVVREAIEALAAHHGISATAAEAIVVGDTPLDVEAAHLAGARSLAVATGAHQPAALSEAGAEWVLPDLAATERVLEVLLG
ncbi:MAG: HAD family hydrolase [Dehalococcoidia bacterium]|nr:MAG: HAD family hydrolase [bacterium]MCE7927579.1 HAD family hydrolase [Chloroflexi bacterium CFX7]MCK6563391.1 haloacid dehalogenase-like hydrolase [Dehalococcoidia bacterium]MCL4231475.1 haloacid dehalogenase-like hydrolase [Dehalococcoidia bacterium]NUQ56390.1 HAD family hydrolase [Dehalococcoidia bacterium]